uniref:rapunzel 2 n=1 Tax=Semicossyphus pulcher TaxID=241346 RepID=UPI0037E94FB7
MADAQKTKEIVANILGCVEKVSSFASSIDPIFGVVSSLVGVARKGLVDQEKHPLDKDFQEINAKLKSISEKNHQCLKQIRIDAVNDKYSKYEDYIKHQYADFNTMVAQVKKDPAKTEVYFTDYKKNYEKYKSDLSLDVFYRGVKGTDLLFGRSLLKVYLDNCEGDYDTMERRCSHFTHLFHMGLIALMAYTAVTEDNEEKVRQKWAKRVEDIQLKMQEVLRQCKTESS